MVIQRSTIHKETIMALDNQDLYSIYVAGLAKATGLPANPPNLILTGNALPANLAFNSKSMTNPPTLPQALAQIYNLADTELYPQGIFDQTTNSFFNDYATYIDNLVPQGSQKAPTPTQQGQINLIKGNLATATTQFNTDQTTAFTSYQQALVMYPGQYPSFQSYLSQTTWGATLNTDANAMNGYNSQLNNIYSAVYGQDYVAIQLAKTTVDSVRIAKLGSSAQGPTVMSIAVASGTQVVPDYNPGDLSQFSTWVDTTVMQHGNAGEQAITIGFSTSSAMYDFSKSTYFSQTNWGSNFWFWSAGGSSTSSSTQVNVDSAASNFNLRMAFDAITTVPVAAGPWFDSSLMYAYPNKGNLIRPTALLIAMYPSITVTMDSSSYASAFSAYNSSSGFGVGAFWTSASTQTSTSATSLQATWNASSNSVTMASQSTTPVVVGMLVAPL
jgi:hypothetical protein